MKLHQNLRSKAAYMWQGPAGFPRSLQLEWRFIGIRWLGILFVAPGLVFANLPLERMLGAYAVLLVAAGSGRWRPRWRTERRRSWPKLA